MILESKYNIGDKVYPIHKAREPIWIPCKSCGETGIITYNDGEKAECPRCWGEKGKVEWRLTKWMLIDNYPKEVRKKAIECGDHVWLPPFKIEQIRIEQEKNNKEVRYMCKETGVGSGTVWSEKELFLSREEAQLECDKRNSVQL
jgi:hypothetical protein